MTGAKSEQAIVEGIVAKLENAPVECDGFARIVSTALAANNIDHQVFIGALDGPEGIIPMHFWIRWNGHIIDCRARMWLGSEAPHGIFESAEGWIYDGEEASIEPLPSGLFFLLANVDLEELV